MIRIALDAMGGDFAPKTNVLGAMQAVKKYDDIEITLFGDENKIKEYLTDSTRINVVHTDKYFDMGEHDAVKAIRSKEPYSMILAMQACKEGKCDCTISAGPTQVVVVAGHMVLKKIKGMHRIALAPFIPTANGNKILLDSGANVELRPEHIAQLAYYATIMAKETLGVEKPKVGLINIGSEEGKGREVDKETYQVLKEDERINFVGNIEPKEMFFSDCDIFINDGFTCNILLKTLEGTAKYMGACLKKEIKSSFKSKIGALFMKKSLKRFKKVFDASEAGGAMLCGLTSLVIKAHGNSDEVAICNAIRQARTLVNSKLVERISQELGDNSEE
ncbi:MAG: phosphate acyltransferase PlsX [Acholeplasmatales bacterium]|nr:phosphate acyltransferase PlsX [Acholeplasmatales bacterium]